MGYFIIKAQLPSLNQYVRACKAGKHQGNEFKKEIEELIGWSIRQYQASGKLSPMENTPCRVHIDWHEATKRRDVDNIQSAQKFILDALQNCGILKNDSRRFVKQIHHLIVDDKEDYVVVRLEKYES